MIVMVMVNPISIQVMVPPTNTQQLLLARRLDEAGARVVTLTYGFWDGHGGNFQVMRDHCPKLDQGFQHDSTILSSED